MKFKVFFGKTKLALLVAVTVIALAAVIVNLLFLIGVGKMVTNVPAAAGVSLALSVLIIAFAATIYFMSYYKFDDEKIEATISFFKDYIGYSSITDVKEDAESHELYVVFNYNTAKAKDLKGSIKLLVKPNENEKIVKLLQEKNPAILYESFINDKDDDKADDKKDVKADKNADVKTEQKSDDKTENKTAKPQNKKKN